MRFRPIQTGFGRRIPVILQSENAECGLACLAMILGANGHLIDLATLRRRAGVSGSGLSLASLIRIAGHFGMHARPVKLDLAGLTRLNIPSILHWNFNHFVVIVKITHQSVVIHDPAIGRRKLKISQLSRSFTGVALELAPAVGFERRDDRHVLRIRDMFRHIPSLRASLLVLGALSLGLEVIALLNPMLTQVIVDEVITTGDRSLLWTIAGGLGLLVALQAVLATVRTWLSMLLATRISVRWNVSLFTHLMGLPQDFFTKRGAGDIFSRFNSLSTIQQTFTTDLVQSVMDGIMAIGMLVMIVIYGKWLAGVVAVSSCLDLLIRLIMFGPYRETLSEKLVYDASQQGHFLESLRGIRSIKLLSMEGRRQGTWVNRMIDSINANLRIQRYDLVLSRAYEVIFGVDRLLMVVLGARMVISGSMSVGMLVAFLSYRDQFATRFGNLIAAGFKVRNLKVQSERLSDIALSETEDAETAPLAATLTLSPVPTVVPIIECRDIGYRYGEEDQWVLRHVDLAIQAGESFAITGPSGCGKSTLLAIMMGLIRPEEGVVIWNGNKLSSQNRGEYRARIAGVLQDDILLSGSLAENIAGFDETIDMEKVVQCAENAQILADILRMPMGFETLIGEMGNTLSGGQRQRVVLARALYRTPDILFLDEATSHLDVTAEQGVEAVLNSLPITRVIITHREETANRVDRKLELKAL